MKASLILVITKLEDLFDKANDQFYNGELEKPVISVSPDTTSGAYGWITSWRAWSVEGQDKGKYEINMCAEHLNRPFEELSATLLHEMAHLYCLQHDIKDTSRGGTYHNKKFKEVAEQHGLFIERDDKYGWTITKLNDDGKEFISSLNGDGFTLHRTKMNKVSSKKKSSSKKYVCPTCGTIVRATKEVRIMCADCDENMELEGKE